MLYCLTKIAQTTYDHAGVVILFWPWVQLDINIKI